MSNVQFVFYSIYAKMIPVIQVEVISLRPGRLMKNNKSNIYIPETSRFLDIRKRLLSPFLLLFKKNWLLYNECIFIINYILTGLNWHAD